MSQGPARAGFLGPGDGPLGASFGGLDGDPQSARDSLCKNYPDSNRFQHIPKIH